MEKKNDPVVSIETPYSSALFGKPLPVSPKKCRKTIIIIPMKDNDGSSVPQPLCIEDEMQKLVALNFNDVTLSSLIDKGVEPHALDMIDTSKLGVDAGVDALANHLIKNASDYVETPKSE